MTIEENRGRAASWLLLSALVVVADQLSKAYITRHFLEFEFRTLCGLRASFANRLRFSVLRPHASRMLIGHAIAIALWDQESIPRLSPTHRSV